MHGVADPSVGLAYASPLVLPEDVRRKFASLVCATENAPHFPRNFFVALAVETFSREVRDARGALTVVNAKRRDGAPAARFTRERVIVVGYDRIVVGDARTGTMIQHVALPHGLVACTACDEDACVVGLSIDPEYCNTSSSVPPSCGDRLLTFAHEHDATSLMRVLDVLMQHHAGTELPVRHVEHLAAVYATLALRPAVSVCGDDAPLDTRIDPPRQLWALVNPTLPTVADRMSHVKATFSAVDSETKQVAADMESSSLRQRHQNEHRIAQLTKMLTLEERQHAAAHVASEELDRLDASCRDLLADLERKKREHGSLRVSLGGELDQWQKILLTRQKDELNAKRRLAKQQAAAQSAVESLAAEIGQVEARVCELEKAVSAYSDDAYTAAENDRDAALKRLDAATRDLADEEARSSKRHGRRLAAAADEALETNKALHKILRAAERDKLQERQAVKAIEAQLAAHIAEINRLADASKLVSARVDVGRRRNDEYRAVLEAAAAEATPLRTTVSKLEADRGFYYAVKGVHAAAVRKRALSERSHSEQRTQCTERAIDQMLHNVRLSLSLKHGPSTAPTPRSPTGSVGSASASASARKASAPSTPVGASSTQRQRTPLQLVADL